MESVPVAASLPAQYFRSLFSSDLIPHGNCFHWIPEVLWIHVAADALLGLSFAAIALSLFYLYFRRRGNVPFAGRLFLLGGFSAACAAVFVFTVFDIWLGIYRFTGLFKILAAVLAFISVFIMIPLLPRLLHLPRTEGMVQDLSRKTVELTRVNDELERFNRVAVGREERILELKDEVNRLCLELGRKPPYPQTWLERRDAP